MSFAHPLALLLLFLLVPVALLYRLRVRAPRRTVGTGLFWQKALAEERSRGRWQRWRSPVSLALQMILVALLAVAAAGPQAPAPKRMVLIIDNSATMRATDVKPIRLDEAKKVARRLIDSLRSCDEMAVVTVSPDPTEVQPLTSDRELLNSAVDSVQALAEPAAIEWAVKLAREIPMRDEDRLKPGLPAETPPRIVLITDACAKEATKRAQESGVEVLRVGTAAGNLAITCFTGRRSRVEPAKCEVLVEVRNQGDQSAQGSVTITVDKKSGQLPSPDQPSVGARRGAGGDGGLQSVAATPFAIVKDGRWQHVFTLDLPAAARLTAKIEPGDSYVFDDTAVLDMPAAPPAHHVKLWDADRSGLKEILAANQRVELIPGPAGNKSQAGKPDLRGQVIHVIDGKTPETLPAGPTLIFATGACDLWQLDQAVADPVVTRMDQGSPITAGVQLFDAYLPEARQLKMADSVRSVARPILWADAAPLGYAIDRPQGRVVVIPGNLATSNLASQAAFPQLLDQALDWLDGQPPWKDEVVGWDQRAGTVGHRRTALVGMVASAGPPTRALGGPALASSLVPPYGNRAEEHGGTDIRVPNNIGSDASALVLENPWPPLWIVPAIVAAALVIIEWCLYQRRWTT